MKYVISELKKPEREEKEMTFKWTKKYLNKKKKVLIMFKMIKQKYKYDCGTVCFSVLKNKNIILNYDKIIKDCKTTEEYETLP